jgi:hypothetical protein
MKRHLHLAGVALAAAGLLAGASRAHAQSATITSNSPDILMGFRVADGQTNPGGNDNIELDLGYTAATLVAAANGHGGSLVLGGTNFQQDLSVNDLDATFGSSWATRTSGGGKLVWSIFGADDQSGSNEFWMTSSNVFARATNSTQGGVVDEIAFVYSDLPGQTSTANSNQDFINLDASGDSNSYTNAVTNGETGGNWEYNFGTPGNTETTVGDTNAIGFYDSQAGTGNATEIGTFSLSDSGVLTFSTDIAAIPEPSTWAMIGFGAASLLVIRRRRAHA